MRHLSIAAIVFQLFLVSGCSRPDERMYPIGPEVKADLFVIFKTTATAEQVYKFSNETISDPKTVGLGRYLGSMKFFMSTSTAARRTRFPFLPNASDDQRKYVRSRIDSSPIVYKVMENVVPSDVKKVD
jgi:hypothetical protein